MSESLDLALAKLDRQYGRGTVFRGNDEPQPWPSLPTGIWTVDKILGIGGFPQGRIIEIFGPAGSTKSSLGLSTIAQAQLQGHLCLYIDVECALDPIWARRMGVDLKSIMISQPSSGEEAFDILRTVANTGQVKLVVVDSVAALLPKAELEGDIGDANIALQARLMSQALRVLKGELAKSGTAVIFTNQIRMKPGVFYGSPEVTAGGGALAYYASVRLDLRRGELIKAKDGTVTGVKIKVKSVKNKMAPPLLTTEFDFLFEKGFDNIAGIVDLGVGRGLFKAKGSWLYYKDQEKPIAQGRDNLIEVLASDLDFVEQVKKEIGLA